MEVEGNNMNFNLFSDCAFVNNFLYFYSVRDGFLGKWDIWGNNEMKYCDLFSEPHNFIRTISHHEKLYSLESSGKALYIFNVNVGTHDVLKIPYNTFEYDNFIDLVDYEDKILIFPKHQSEIMVLDAASGGTEKIQYDADLLKTVHCGCRHKNFYYFFPAKGRYILAIDLNNFQERKIEINEVIDEFVHCVSYGDTIFLLTERGKVYRWDTISMNILEVFDFELRNPAHQVVVTDCKIIVLPYHQGDDIHILDRNAMYSYVYKDYPIDFAYQASKVWNAYEGMTENEDSYLFAMRSANYALVINKISGEIQWKRPRNMDGQLVRIMAERGESVFYEKEENYSLKDFVGYVIAIA